MTFRSALIALVLLASSANAIGDDQPPIPADRFVYCTVCHGTQTMGNVVIEAPRLSGMQSWYVEQQLHAFKNGWRGTHAGDLIGMEMQPMAVGLSDHDIVEVAKFVSSTQSPRPAVTVAGDVSKGRSLYQSCAACHGALGSGNKELGGPALTGLNDWYLVTQLKKFKNGQRGTNAADIFGNQMAASAQLLADDEAINDVVTYINSIATD